MHLRETQVVQVVQGQRVQPDLKATRDRRDLRVVTGLMVLRDLRVVQAQQDQQVLRDLRVQTAQMVMLRALVRLPHLRDQLVLPLADPTRLKYSTFQYPQVQRVQQDLRGLRVQQAQAERTGLMVPLRASVHQLPQQDQ